MSLTQDIEKAVDVTEAEEKLRLHHVEQLRRWACEKEAEARALFEAANRLER
jgi:hypothetical protein